MGWITFCLFGLIRFEGFNYRSISQSQHIAAVGLHATDYRAPNSGLLVNVVCRRRWWCHMPSHVHREVMHSHSLCISILGWKWFPIFPTPRPSLTSLAPHLSSSTLYYQSHVEYISFKLFALKLMLCCDSSHGHRLCAASSSGGAAILFPPS